MVELPRHVPKSSLDDTLQALAHHRRRAIVRILERITRAPPAELATHLVATEADKPLMDVTRSETEDVLTVLRHRHLPHLTDVGLVTDDGDITLTQHPALQDPAIAAMIATDAPDWDCVLDCLADERRRLVLATVQENEQSIDRDDLAAEVAETAQSDSETGVIIEEVRQRLHHLHLPKLEAAGLIRYDIDDETVTYEGHPELDEELEPTAQDAPRPLLS